MYQEKNRVIYKVTPIRLSADFSAETFQTRRVWHDIFKVLKRKNLQPRILYQTRLLFRTEGEIKNFPDKRKLKEFISTNPTLKEMLKGIL